MKKFSKIISVLVTMTMLITSFGMTSIVSAEETTSTPSAKAHMVDLSAAFNRDIFANVGETVAEGWGFTDKVGALDNPKTTVGINSETVTASLSNGVLFENSVAKIKGGTDLSAYTAATPFDLSHTGDAKNAIVFDKGTMEGAAGLESLKISQNAEGTVFSGRPSKYLLVLNATGTGTQYWNYTINYTDGTTSAEQKTCKVEWAGQEIQGNKTSNLVAKKLSLSEKNVTESPALTGHENSNDISFIAFAIPTEGKIIDSVKMEAHSNYGTAPVLAMTEILLNADDLRTQYGSLKDELDTTLSSIPTIINNAENYNKAKTAIANAENLIKLGFTLSTETSAKIEKLRKQVNALAPHTVDLTSAFNRDIFASVGETVAEGWGYADKANGIDNPRVTIGIDLATVTPSLSKGILSENAVAKLISNSTQDKTSGVGLAETPFDLSHIKEAKNAIVQDDGALNNQAVYTTKTIQQNEAGTVFSGTPSDYLLVLNASGHANQSFTYTLTYTDGTTSEHITSLSWGGAYENMSVLNTEKLTLTDGITGRPAKEDKGFLNKVALVATAIPTSGKIIKSVSVYCHTAYGAEPILAMTEVKNASYLSDKNTELTTLMNSIGESGVTTPEEYTNAKKALEIADYLLSAGCEFDTATSEELAAYRKQVNALTPHTVDLTSYFNRDIFSNVGEAVAEGWGFTDKVGDAFNINNPKTTVGINISTVTSSLSNGVFSKNNVVKIKGSTNLSTYTAETPFDLSHIGESKDAIVFDKGTMNQTTELESLQISQNIEGTVFSGRPSKYLLVLNAVGTGDQHWSYTVNYTDGTTSEQTKCSVQWAGQEIQVNKTSNLVAKKLSLNEKNVTESPALTGHENSNDISFIAFAIPTEGKIIESVTAEARSNYGTAPVLAMTEIPVNYEDLMSDLSFEYTEITTENAQSVKKCALAGMELMDRGYFYDQDMYNAYLSNYKRADVVSKSVNGIYVENNFTEANGMVKANVTLTNILSTENNCILVIASYTQDGEKLLNVKCGELIPLAGSATDIPKTIELPIDANATAYKVFVWENLSTLKPIAVFCK